MKDMAWNGQIKASKFHSCWAVVLANVKLMMFIECSIQEASLALSVSALCFWAVQCLLVRCAGYKKKSTQPHLVPGSCTFVRTAFYRIAVIF